MQCQNKGKGSHTCRCIAMCVYTTTNATKPLHKKGAIQYRVHQIYIYTSAGFRVTIEKKTTTAFTSKATRGVHTDVSTAMVTLAFVNVCMKTGVATDDHRHNAMHIHPQVVVHSSISDKEITNIKFISYIQ